MPRPPALSLGAVVIASCSVSLVPHAVRADALPPPEDCPAGQVWVNGHSGGCREEAPTNCPAGWRGAVGGFCYVAVPDQDGHCPPGTAAVAVTLCFERYLDHGNGRVRYEPPHELQVPVGIVGPAGQGAPAAVCAGAERHAGPASVCLAAGEAPFAFVKDTLDARGPRSAEPPRTGCARGCSGAGAGADLMGAVAVAVWLARRARRAYRSVGARPARCAPASASPKERHPAASP